MRMITILKKPSFKIAAVLTVLFSVFIIGSAIINVQASENSKAWAQMGLLLTFSLITFFSLEKILKKYLPQSQNIEALVQNRIQERDYERARYFNSAKLASLGEISAGVAHEINNPLAVIEGKVHLIKMYLEKNPGASELERHLTKISDMVQRISKIIRGLRYFSREADQDPMGSFSINNLIAEVQDLCAMKIKVRGIKFSISLPETELRAYGREVQISQVLISLIHNAMDAVKDEKNPRIEIKVSPHAEGCDIAVLDNGSGVPDSIKEKIFQPFFSTKGIGKGTGLGLSISHGIIKQHGSDLSFRTENNLTVFEFTLAHPAENAIAAA